MEGSDGLDDGARAAKPPAERGFFAVSPLYFDPWDPKGPKPGDVVFFTTPARSLPGERPKPGCVKHVAVLVEPDADGRPRVASNYGFPRANGNTTSVVAIADLMREVPGGSEMVLTSFPIEDVPARIDRSLAELRAACVPAAATLTVDERRRLRLF